MDLIHDMWGQAEVAFEVDNCISPFGLEVVENDVRRGV